MSTRISLLLTIFFICISGADAKDLGGRTAIGTGMFHFDPEGEFASLLPGIDFRFWSGGGVGFQGTLGYLSQSAEKDDEKPYDKTESHLLMDFNFLFNPSKGEHVNLNIILGAGVIVRKNLGNRDERNRTDSWITFGFAPEVFIYDNLSLETTAGLYINFYGDTKEESEYYEDRNDSYSSVLIGGVPALGFMGAGFHYYFK